MSAKKIPATFRKLVATRKSNKFREVVSVQTVPTPTPGDGQVLVKNRYVGINASDINFTAGRYDPKAVYPLDVGFEAVGEVVQSGPKTAFKPGQAVMYIENGAFSDFKLLDAKVTIPLPEMKPEYLPFILSGNTAAISLDRVGEIKAGETVLVTAAAGGTGQIAVQWAKLAGCHVIGTCSTDDKVQFLKDIGCDRPVNYKKENLRAVLKKEYPKGVDVVYETIGGDIFDTCVENLAVKGRLIIIGMITTYESEKGLASSTAKTLATLPSRLLSFSSSIRGFMLFRFNTDMEPYVNKQLQALKDGKLKVIVDMGKNAKTGPFVGLEKIADAVELLAKSASVRGFFLNNYAQDWAPYMMKQVSLFNDGKIKSFVDKGEKTALGPFVGLDKITDAVEDIPFGVIYNGPTIAANGIGECFSGNRDQIKSIDLACGTGFIGDELYRLGFENIDGLDPSAGMLKRCEPKPYYKTLYQEYCGDNILPIADGGYVIIVMNKEYLDYVEEYTDKLEALMASLVTEGALEMLERRVVQNYSFNQEGLMFKFRVLKQ